MRGRFTDRGIATSINRFTADAMRSLWKIQLEDEGRRNSRYTARVINLTSSACTCVCLGSCCQAISVVASDEAPSKLRFIGVIPFYWDLRSSHVDRVGLWAVRFLRRRNSDRLMVVGQTIIAWLTGLIILSKIMRLGICWFYIRIFKKNTIPKNTRWLSSFAKLLSDQVSIVCLLKTRAY